MGEWTKERIDEAHATFRRVFEDPSGGGDQWVEDVGQMGSDLIAALDEIERLRGENSDLRLACAMACEEPCGDCGGCNYAEELHRE